MDEQDLAPYLVMEFIEGNTLQQKLNTEGALGLESILRIGMQSAQALHAAHERGLIHGDVKPSNILLEKRSEQVKITDFGLARAIGDVRESEKGRIRGTPQFMSPEQRKDLARNRARRGASRGVGAGGARAARIGLAGRLGARMVPGP